MAIKGSTKKQTPQKTKKAERIVEDQPVLKISDILNFSSAIAVVLFTSIFYTSGWVYVSTWYSFYGLNASHLQIPTQTILVFGIPGILSAALIGFVLYISFALSRAFGIPSEEIAPVRFLVILAFTAAAAISLLVNIIQFLISISTGLNFINTLSGIRDLSKIETSTSMSVAINFILLSVLALAAVVFILFILDSTTYRKLTERNKVARRIHKSAVHFLNLPQVWTGIIITVYFVIAVVISFFMGTIDAQRGGQLMSSNWKMPIVILHSEQEIASLSDKEQTNLSSTDYQYGPFVLLYENSSGYYLTSQKKTTFYATSPTLYIVPKDLAANLVIEIQPQNDVMTLDALLNPSTPTPIPITTNTPIPTLAATPTLTP